MRSTILRTTCAKGVVGLGKHGGIKTQKATGKIFGIFAWAKDVGLCTVYAKFLHLIYNPSRLPLQIKNLFIPIFHPSYYGYNYLNKY